MKLNRKKSVTIYNSDYKLAVKDMKKNGEKVNIILTSPPYATGRSSVRPSDRKNHYSRYDTKGAEPKQDTYVDFTLSALNDLDEVLEENGVILWNISYGTDNTNLSNMDKDGYPFFKVPCYIMENTPFTVADVIIWKKKSALPNNTSPNKLTRLCEFVYVLVRKSELKTFKSNKKVSSVSKTGQKFYESCTNFIEARNNDESCPLNKATFSSELVGKLLGIYARDEMSVYDPFGGTGTTMKAVVEEDRRLTGIMSELSEEQCEWTKNRILKCNNAVKYKIKLKAL